MAAVFADIDIETVTNALDEYSDSSPHSARGGGKGHLTYKKNTLICIHLGKKTKGYVFIYPPIAVFSSW